MNKFQFFNQYQLNGIHVTYYQERYYDYENGLVKFSKECGDEYLNLMDQKQRKATITDFAIILGGQYEEYFLNGKSVKVGEYWTDAIQNKIPRRIDESGKDSLSSFDEGQIGARPVLTYSELEDVPTNGIAKRISDSKIIVEYGYYPQDTIPKEEEEKLESLFKQGKLVKIKNTYTINSFEQCLINSDNLFKPEILEEYQYHGRQFVRVKNRFGIWSNITLSNGNTYQLGDYIWIEVKPVTWILYDPLFDKKYKYISQNGEDLKVMYSEKILFAGIHYSDIPVENIGHYDFPNVTIKQFMNNYFSKDLTQHQSPKLQSKKCQLPSTANLFAHYTTTMDNGLTLINHLNMDKLGYAAKITDFSLLLGGTIQPNEKLQIEKSSPILGEYVTIDYNNFGELGTYNIRGNYLSRCGYTPEFGIRPIIQYVTSSYEINPVTKKIDQITHNTLEEFKNNKTCRENDLGLLEVEYGFYPQDAVNSTLQQELEYRYQQERLLKTNHTYTYQAKIKELFGGRKLEVKKEKFYEEYQYKGRKFVRVIANQFEDVIANQLPLSNGEVYQNGDIVWVEVKPVTWIINELSLSGMDDSEVRNYERELEIQKKENKLPKEVYITKLHQNQNDPITAGFENLMIVYPKKILIAGIEAINIHAPNRELNNFLEGVFANDLIQNLQPKRSIVPYKELQSKKTPIVLDEEKKDRENDINPKKRIKAKKTFQFENTNSPIIKQDTTHSIQNNTLDNEEEIPLTTSKIEDNSQKENEEAQKDIDNTYLDITAVEEENTENFSNENINKEGKEENQSLDKNQNSNQKEFEKKQEEINNTYLDNTTIKEKITKEEYQKILTLIKTPIFNQLRKQFSEKEAVIISLMFGYIDEKYFSKEAIAKFLDIETEEVTKIAKKVLLSYKKYLNQFIDNTIELIEKPVEQIAIPTKVKKQN